MATRALRAGILLLAAALRLYRLDQNGYDNEYYSAAVRSMAESWHALLYNSFDPAGFVSVDKPPLALWVQAAAVRLFGFHGLTVLLPQALAGVAAVALLDTLVRRRFGASAGLLAALALALTPISVAADRSNNTESCLVLVLLLGAWALLRAAEQGSRGHLVLALALVGVGFNVKMLAAWVTLPAFAATYVLGAPVPWRRRLADLSLAGIVLAAVSASWIAAYDLTPAGRRPFAGSTRSNSMAELAVGHNGIGRFVRLSRAPASGYLEAGSAGSDERASRASRAEAPARPEARLFVRAPVGPLRLADGQLAAQVGWLLPLALLALGAGLARPPWRPPLSPARAALVLWSLWALTYAAVYSWAGGIFHFYYLVLLAPPLAALSGIGFVAGWRLYVNGGWRAGLLPVALLVSAAWQVYIERSAVGLDLPAGDWRRWVHWAPLIGCGLAAVVLVAVHRVPAARAAAAGAATAAFAALLVLPGAWALSSVVVKGIPVLPSADLARLAPGESQRDARQRARAAWYARLISFLQGNRQGERYLLATSTTRVAAPVIIATGEPVMAMGGFHGLDPILTPEGLARLVEEGQLRFVMQGDLSFIDRRMGAAAAGKAVGDWIRANGKPVDPALWWAGASDESEAGGPRARVLQLYDLRPGTALSPG